MILTLLVIGATGDLTSRMLLPALADLDATRGLPDGFRLVDAARRDWGELSHIRNRRAFRRRLRLLFGRHLRHARGQFDRWTRRRDRAQYAAAAANDRSNVNLLVISGRKIANNLTFGAQRSPRQSTRLPLHGRHPGRRG